MGGLRVHGVFVVYRGVGSVGNHRGWMIMWLHFLHSRYLHIQPLHDALFISVVEGRGLLLFPGEGHITRRHQPNIAVDRFLVVCQLEGSPLENLEPACVETGLPLVGRDRKTRFVTVKHARLNVLSLVGRAVSDHLKGTVIIVSHDVIVVQLELDFVSEGERTPLGD